MEETIWKQYERCVPFHGHRCGGLAIGVRAAAEAMQRLGLRPWGNGESGMGRTDEEVVCISENDACGVDAIQVLLGCTPGKGSLKFELQGKMAFNIYNRETGESIRLCLKDFSREDAIAYFQTQEIVVEEGLAKTTFILEAPLELVFSVTPVQFPLPGKAPSYPSHTCAACGESAAEPWMRQQEGAYYCKACDLEAESKPEDIGEARK